MNNQIRLKLYDCKITIRFDKKTKEKIRKDAFKSKQTLSEYIRNLIMLGLTIQKTEKLNLKLNQNFEDIENRIVRGKY